MTHPIARTYGLAVQDAAEKARGRVIDPGQIPFFLSQNRATWSATIVASTIGKRATAHHPVAKRLGEVVRAQARAPS